LAQKTYAICTALYIGSNPFKPCFDLASTALVKGEAKTSIERAEQRIAIFIETQYL
jgi:hypothetical protein